MRQPSVFSRAHRVFRDSPRFRFVQSEPEILARYRELTTPHLGNLVGSYVNPPSVQPEMILVTEGGLLAVGAASLLRIEFAGIETVRGSTGEEGNPAILLDLRSGAIVHLRVGGADRRLEDVSRFVRFLDRVLADRSGFVRARAPSRGRVRATAEAGGPSH